MSNWCLFNRGSIDPHTLISTLWLLARLAVSVVIMRIIIISYHHSHHSIMGQWCSASSHALRKFPPSWVCSHSKFMHHSEERSGLFPHLRNCSHEANNENAILWAPKLTLFVKLDILWPNSPKFLYCGSTVSKYSERNLMANYNGFTDAIIFNSSSHKSA